MNLLIAPVLAAISAMGIHTQTDVPIDRVYVPFVVFSSTGGFEELEQGHTSGSAVDTTPDEIEDAKKAIEAQSGVPADRLKSWLQPTPTYTFRGGGRTSVNLGVILIDLGTPAQARAIAPRLAALRSVRHISAGWNQIVGVDCAGADRRIRDQLNQQARDTALLFEGLRGDPSPPWTMTTDPRNQTFQPVTLCPVDRLPVVTNATYGVVPTYIQDSFTRFASASVKLMKVATNAIEPPADATVQFPFTTFGFPQPIIGQQNRAFALHGGKFAATPGAVDVAVPAHTVVLEIKMQDPSKIDEAMAAIRSLGLGPSEYREDVAAHIIYVRLRQYSDEAWEKLKPYGSYDGNVFRFIKDCSPYVRYAHQLARSGSRDLAQAAAGALHVKLGPLVVETDWAGASNTAMCGSDGSGDLDTLIALAKSNRHSWSFSQPNFAYFWDSLYAAWTLGAPVPTVASDSIVDRLKPVITFGKPGEEVVGVATIDPDAFFYQARTASAFTTTVVSARDEVPKGSGAGNVVTDCAAALRRGIANAVTVAQMDRPVRAFYAQPARLLSIACLPANSIGQTFSSMPTVYNDSSATGAAQVEQRITVLY